MRRPILSAALLLAMAVSAQKYTNPVYDWDSPDPTVQQGTDGTYYCYATGCQTRKSTDLVNWTNVSNVFNRPTWNDTTYVKDGEQHTDYYSMWAADVNRVDDKYIMYYASALWGNGSRTGIGVATATTPTRFTDVGHLFRSTEIGVENSIDPCYFEEWDQKYLIWGSFNGLYITELTEDGLGIKNWKGAKRIAGTAFEGVMIHKHGDYYYLFASTGSCCEGVKSTYQTVVGRSRSLMGPYISKSGEQLLNNSRTVIITANDRWKGPGHNSEIITDDEGQDWIMYHAYDAQNPDKGRVLMLDRLLWDKNNWPYVEGGSPSTTEQDAPILYKGNGKRMNFKFQNLDFMKSGFHGWTLSSDSQTEATSGLGNIFYPVMHVQGGQFVLEQTVSGCTDGLYELQLDCSNNGPVDVFVGSVLTPIANDGKAGTLTDKDASQLLKDGTHRQHFYGLVVGGKLSIGLCSEGMTEAEQLWAANAQVIRRDADPTAIAATRAWYEQRSELVLADESANNYYKGKLEKQLKTLKEATTPSEQQDALIQIHKTLNSLKALDPLYTRIEATVVPNKGSSQTFDLLGRPVPTAANCRGILITDGRKHL
ncbi:MAG: family 43 glycosylhydrolase [Bacteroidaceae bacterium]|nr:family 43 glycosylhydrolase [Bacteroidaceae bacterium]